MGAPVNLAARLCSAADPGETLMSASTFDLVRGLVAAEETTPFNVKGVSAPVSAFRMRA